MALKTYKATTPSRRHKVIIDRSGLTKRTLASRGLLENKSKITGRNSEGRITVRHRGGGVKRKYRVIDFKRDKFDLVGKVISIEYDPNRTVDIALLQYLDGEKRFILRPNGLKVGDAVISSKKEIPLEVGNATLLKYIPSGIFVNNVELYPNRGGVLGRAAGAKIQVQGMSGKYCQLKLPSGEVRLVHGDCLATIGILSNDEHMHENLGKAGTKRRKGIRPTVRGVVMGAPDHPHGGGEGRVGTGRPAKDKWGHKVGTRTRKNKRTTKFIIKPRYK